MITADYARVFNLCRELVGGSCALNLQPVSYTLPNPQWLAEDFNDYWFKFAGYHGLHYDGQRFNCRHFTRTCVAAMNLAHAVSNAPTDNDVAGFETEVMLRRAVLGIEAGRHRHCVVLCDDFHFYTYEPQTYQVCLADDLVAAGAIGFFDVRN